MGTKLLTIVKTARKADLEIAEKWCIFALRLRRALLPSFFYDLSPENFLWRRIFFLWSRKFFLLRKTFFFLRRKNSRCFRKTFVKLPKNFLTEVKVLNFFTFWATLTDVKKVDKVILSTFSKRAMKKETAKLMSVSE